MKHEVFLDTSYAIALSSPTDTFHFQALALAEWLQSTATLIVTTRPVMLEIGNALSKPPYRQAAIRLLKAFEQDPQFKIIPWSESLYHQAFDLYGQRLDKTWGLVDCVSFVVMRQRAILEALTTDRHFQQAGFRVLLQRQ